MQTSELPAELRQQLEVISRGAEEVIPLDDVASRLAEGRPLRVKVGFDPTAADLHLGHTVVINKLRQFQELGHQVIFLVGDFTARIGDPSGRDATRKPLTGEQIEANAATYASQVFKILDIERTEVRRNSEWMSELGAQGMIRLAAQATVARMLERDDFSKRFAAQAPISLHEFLYPLCQGYDSVALEADMELGGTDQKFNLLMGRQLQQVHGQRPQAILTMPILEGLDGVKKMSKSLGNYIGIDEPAEEIYGKLMSVSDDLMWRYYELLSFRDLSDIARLRKEAHPRDAKDALAREIVARFHDEASATRAAEAFVARFAKGETPDELESVSIAVPAEGLGLAAVLKQAGLVSSTSDGMRMVGQGAVKVDGERAEDARVKLAAGFDGVISVGKRRIKKVVLSAG